MAQQPCTTDARQVVDQLYRHMLERQADTASVHWVQQLESGRMDVREVVRELAKSPEYIQRFYFTEVGEGTPYERAVARLYRHILGRQPDAEGQRVHAELGQRRGAGAVIDRIVDSKEYDLEFGDWGAPGSGGIHYCAPANRTTNQLTVPVVPVEQRRFRVMDTNNDGAISRTEWRGNARSFDIHDWNNDDVLTGDEINEASARRGRTTDDEAYDTMDSFEYLDTNNDNRVDAHEWHGTVFAFNQLDVNNDNAVSRQEMYSYRGAQR
jgi:hypothetical protein